ncbi:hypothetical protein SMD44_08193 [Streptomyces alboflavus]|uniref:Uncharacterized protein n=1 Tax=Streptomyces alboflavus TaxID=67267 RepID=A0A1Z1WQK4_9ACTN|nr:hypothetical protein SMD44_08193 [Streptomyces alboflavus]
MARLVLGRGSLRRLHVDVDVVARPELAYGVRQLAAGYLQGTVAEPDEFDDEAAPDAYGDDQGGHDGDKSEEHRGPGRGEHASGQGVGAVGGVPCRAVGDGALRVQHGRVGGVPGADRGRREGLLAGLGEEHLVLHGSHVGVRGSCHETLPRGTFGAAQIARCRLEECLPGVGGAGEPAQSLAVEGAASRALASSTSSRASISPARENSSSTRAWEPDSPLWTAESAPLTLKAAVMALVYCP